MPLVVDEDRSVMRMAMDRVMNILMADLLGEFEEAEFSDGRFVVSSTLLEEELAVLIAARRLGLEEEPVLDEAWDFFFDDARLPTCGGGWCTGRRRTWTTSCGATAGTRATESGQAPPERGLCRGRGSRSCPAGS